MMSELFDRLGAALAQRYRLERELGQGGMAKVFLAHDLKYDRDRAFRQLQRAFDHREPGLMFLKVAPWLDPLRGDPRCGLLIEKLGLS